MHKLISFIGDAKNYSEISYLDNSKVCKTKFALVAICDFFPVTYDEIYLVCTEGSSKFFDDLKMDLLKLRENKVREQSIHKVQISNNKDINEFWLTFESINAIINSGDTITIDFTHGYRHVPIFMSAGLNYIFRAKQNLSLSGVYYGLINLTDMIGEIVDLKAFYEINEWADGVSRLIDNADTQKLVELGKNTNYSSFPNIRNPKLVEALKTLTDCLQNIDVNNISSRAQSALLVLNDGLKSASPSESQLLKLAIEKFSVLEPKAELGATYDVNYLKIQLEIIKMLLGHRIYMQAFTAMRELIGSIGMFILPARKNKIIGSDGQRARDHCAGEFVQMVERANYKIKVNEIEVPMAELRQTPDDKNNNRLSAFKYLIIGYDVLMEYRVISKLKEIGNTLSEIRNGFDHAWLGKADSEKILQKLEPESKRILKILSDSVELICINEKAIIEKVRSKEQNNAN